MEVSFEHNIREVARDLSDFALRQLPFATSLALNDTALAIERNTLKALDRTLDRPTPFTRRGLLVLRSSKSRLWADVLFKDVQAEYLRWQEGGGTRGPKGRAIPVPVTLRRNAFGNMGRRAVRTAAARPDVFSGRPGGGRLKPGLYQRLPQGGLRLLVAFEARVDYKPRLGFGDGAERTAIAYFPIALERAMRRALASAR